MWNGMCFKYVILFSPYTRTVNKHTDRAIFTEAHKHWIGDEPETTQLGSERAVLCSPHASPPSLHTNSKEGEVLARGHRDLWVHF